MKRPQWNVRWRHLWITAGLVALIAVLVHALFRPSIRLDGIGYYAPLASLVFDHDLDLHNEVEQLPNWMRRAYFTTPEGRTVDPYAVGAALLWTPALLVARATDPGAARYADPSRWRWGSPAFEPRYVRAIALATALEALLGCLALFAAARRLAGTLPAAWAVAGAALGTPVVYYALAEPSYAHTASFLAVAALLAAVLSRRELPLWALGALWGLVTIVRWQDGVIGLVLVPRLLNAMRGLGAAGVVRVVAEFGLAAGLVFLPQCVFWKVVYGHAFVLTKTGFMHWGSPHIVPMLFSIWQGAFVWCPLLLVGFVGLALVPRRDLRWLLWVSVALEIYISAATLDWWGSAGFGPRRLVAVAPIAGLGLAAIVARAAGRARIAAVAVIVIAACWTVRLAQYNLAGSIPENPAFLGDYKRDYPDGDPRTQIYALWDYPRFGREILHAERRMWMASPR